jgi:hypothetical protein
MSAAGYPFLIGRGRSVGVQVVVTPDFMALPPGLDAIRSLARDRPTPAGEAEHARITTLDGERDAVFRVVVAHGAAFGVEPRGALRDDSGRPVHVTEGMLLASGSVNDSIDEGLLQAAHRYVSPAFQTLWSASGRMPVIRSNRMVLPSHPAGERAVLTLRPSTPPRREPADDVEPQAAPRALFGRPTLLIIAALVLTGVLGFLSGRALHPAPLARTTVLGPSDLDRLQNLATVCRTLETNLPDSKFGGLLAVSSVSARKWQQFREPAGAAVPVCAFSITQKDELAERGVGHLDLSWAPDDTSDSRRRHLRALVTFDQRSRIVNLVYSTASLATARTTPTAPRPTTQLANTSQPATTFSASTTPESGTSSTQAPGKAATTATVMGDAAGSHG